MILLEMTHDIIIIIMHFITVLGCLLIIPSLPMHRTTWSSPKHTMVLRLGPINSSSKILTVPTLPFLPSLVMNELSHSIRY